MNKTVIVWRESVYKNDYICRCGKKLFEGKNIPDDMLFDTETDELICPECGWNVARISSFEKASKEAIRIEEA